MKLGLLSRALVASLVLLAGCGTLPQGVTRAGTAPNAQSTGARTLYVMPRDGVAPVLSAIQGAKSSIQMQMYMLLARNAGQQIIDALAARSKAGVNVQIILDGRPFAAPKPPECKPSGPATTPNQTAFDTLIAAGVKVKWSDPKFRYTHQKSMVIDGNAAWVMTTNFSNSAFTVNREYIVVDRQKAHVDDIKRLFAADWAGTAFAPQDPALVVSPVNARGKILGLIDAAKKTLLMQVEFMSDPEVIQHVGARVAAGVDVTAMLSYQEKSACGSDVNAVEAKLLADAGVKKVAFLKHIKLHAKTVVVDDRQAYVGSENFTSNSLNNNRELGLLLSDPAIVKQIAQVAHEDWAAQNKPVVPAQSFGFAVEPAAPADL